MTEQLSNQGNDWVDATERTNIVDVLSPVLEFQPQDGLGLLLEGIVPQGEKAGIPIYADLRDSNDDPLPTRDTAIALQLKLNGEDDRDTISYKMANIRQYNTLSISEQQSDDYIDQTKHRLKNTDAARQEGETPAVGVSDVDQLFVSVESSAQIDWSNSALYVDGDAVKKVT